ncbi:MAG: hypothetical protein J0M11_01455 [Anaerolineae bacterium]|nr:hypothetical protein [Anaerolineae bacterium]
MAEEFIDYEEISSREELIDLLEEATERLEEKSALISDLKTRLAKQEGEHVINRFAFLAALGDAIPADYDGKLTDGTEPVNYLARHLNFEMTVLKEKNEGLMLSNTKNIEWIEHLMQSGLHDDCRICNDIEDFLELKSRQKP